MNNNNQKWIQDPLRHLIQSPILCSELTIETVEQGVQYVKVNNRNNRTMGRLG